MPDEIRICQCGKAAGHDSLCRRSADDEREVERIDRRIEEEYARRREERHAKRRQAFDAERRGQRAGLTILELHRLAIERQAKISTVAAGSIEPSRGGSEDSPAPPRQQQLDDDPRWREHWHVIRSRLERAHELLDEAEGLGMVASQSTMLGAEKDKRILNEGEGLSPVGVVELLGHDIAGSPQTVRRVRAAAGRSARDGRRTEAHS